MDESTIYIEYKKMRKRERELLREHKQLEKEYGKDENFIESSRRLKIIRKKLNQIVEAKKFQKEKDTRYCAKCKKSTQKGTLDAKFIMDRLPPNVAKQVREELSIPVRS